MSYRSHRSLLKIKIFLPYAILSSFAEMKPAIDDRHNASLLTELLLIIIFNLLYTNSKSTLENKFRLDLVVNLLTNSRNIFFHH